MEASRDVRRSSDEKYCSHCGQIIQAKAEICPKCGVRQFPPPQSFPVTANGRNRIIAAIFAFFLGGLGVHKFYLGRIGWGIVYLLLCWTFIPALLGVIEGILLVIMSDDEFNRKYGQ